MPRKCIICSHPKRIGMDRLIVRGVAIAKIAEQYSVPYHSLFNHSKHHLARQLITSEKGRQMLQLDAVVGEAQSIFERLKELCTMVEEDPSHVSAAMFREAGAALDRLIKLGISCETLSQNKAGEESAATKELFRDGLKRLNVDEVSLLQALLCKMGGEDAPVELPAQPARPQLSAPEPSRQVVIDVSPSPQDDDLPLPVLDEEPAQEPPKRSRTSAPPMAEPTPAPKPRSASQVDRSRREVAERIAGTYLEPWRARHACDDPPSVSEQLQRRGLL